MTLSQYIRYPLSDKDVMKLVEGKANMVMYNQLKNMSNINQVLGPYNAAFIFLHSNGNVGHWTALIKCGNTIEFFDPYGTKPDDLIRSKNFADEKNQDYPYLMNLLYRSGYNIEYNDKKNQKLKSNISTCGRHSAIRILLKDLDVDDYNDLIENLSKENNMTKDELITCLTLLINGGAF